MSAANRIVRVRTAGSGPSTAGGLARPARAHRRATRQRWSAVVFGWRCRSRAPQRALGPASTTRPRALLGELVDTYRRGCASRCRCRSGRPRLGRGRHADRRGRPRAGRAPGGSATAARSPASRRTPTHVRVLGPRPPRSSSCGLLEPARRDEPGTPARRAVELRGSASARCAVWEPLLARERGAGMTVSAIPRRRAATGEPAPSTSTAPARPGTTTMLEASAGTGKTWTIAALVTRMVAEGEAGSRRCSSSPSAGPRPRSCASGCGSGWSPPSAPSRRRAAAGRTRPMR